MAMIQGCQDEPVFWDVVRNQTKTWTLKNKSLGKSVARQKQLIAVMCVSSLIEIMDRADYSPTGHVRTLFPRSKYPNLLLHHSPIMTVESFTNK